VGTEHSWERIDYKGYEIKVHSLPKMHPSTMGVKLAAGWIYRGTIRVLGVSLATPGSVWSFESEGAEECKTEAEARVAGLKRGMQLVDSGHVPKG
jgi:hypothetical protein